MREILFRGKQFDIGEWVEGDLQHTPGGAVAISTCDNFWIVDPETVCQYTGLTDKNGRKIFERDILKLTYDDEESIYVVSWSAEDAMWKIRATDVDSADDMGCWDPAMWEAIGNIFDIPELING